MTSEEADNLIEILECIAEPEGKAREMMSEEVDKLVPVKLRQRVYCSDCGYDCGNDLVRAEELAKAYVLLRESEERVERLNGRVLSLTSGLGKESERTTEANKRLPGV